MPQQASHSYFLSSLRYDILSRMCSLCNLRCFMGRDSSRVSFLRTLVDAGGCRSFLSQVWACLGFRPVDLVSSRVLLAANKPAVLFPMQDSRCLRTRSACPVKPWPSVPCHKGYPTCRTVSPTLKRWLRFRLLVAADLWDVDRCKASRAYRRTWPQCKVCVASPAVRAFHKEQAAVPCRCNQARWLASRHQVEVR